MGLIFREKDLAPTSKDLREILRRRLAPLDRRPGTQGCRTDAQRKACIQWISPLLDDLFEGNVGSVIQRLRKLKPSAANACDELRKCIEYFDEHKKRTHYASFKKHGQLIGSGAVESLHAWVIQARCRQQPLLSRGAGIGV